MYVPWKEDSSKVVVLAGGVSSFRGASAGMSLWLWHDLAAFPRVVASRMTSRQRAV